eukprot:GFUD01062505.1.p1 GENE.GFUD01062505.1~~GFUD01062505.1.p1  ORF type:complete len:530 (+),score=118.84 GFUD01062505.1:81-1670(+)
MAPHPETDLDAERKEELIMEKRLRACRVNIIPRNGGYLHIPPPVNKKPPPPAPSPSAVEKATNPIALRYWNQCMDKAPERKAQEMTQEKESRNNLSTQTHMPPWVSSESYNVNSQTAVKPKSLTPQLQVKVPDITKRVRSESVPRGCQYSRLNVSTEIVHHDDPSPVTERRTIQEKVEVVKVLSTAGSGIKRNNEVKEALGNINRFFSVDKIKRDDAARVANPRHQEVHVPSPVIVDTKPYKEIKEEQIKVSIERTNFQNNSTNRIPKSPQPFRGGRRELSEPRSSNKELKNNQHNLKQNTKINDQTDMNQFMDGLIPELNETQKTQLGLALFNQLSLNIVKDLMAQQIARMSGEDLFSVLNSSSDKAVNMAVPMLFPRTSDDVKLNLVVGCLPKLAPRLKNELFQDTGTQSFPNSNPVNQCLDIRKEDVHVIPRNNICKISVPEIRIDTAEAPDLIVEEVHDVQEENECVRNQTCIITQPEIRIDLAETGLDEDNPGDEKKEWEWEDGEELEYEFYEQDVQRAIATML